MERLMDIPMSPESLDRLRFLNPPDVWNKNVLALGAGLSEVTLHFREEGARNVLAVDPKYGLGASQILNIDLEYYDERTPSVSAFNVFKEDFTSKNKAVDYIAATAANLPMIGNVFDYAYSLLALEYYMKYPEVYADMVEEIKRVLCAFFSMSQVGPIRSFVL